MFKPEELGRENSNEKFNALQKTMTLSPWDGRLTRELQFVRQLRDKFPQVDVRDCSALVWNLRKIKSPAELDVMRQAARIGVKAHNALIQSTRPGMPEKALARRVRVRVPGRTGAQDLAYDTIIMSGKNHAYGHYHTYDRVLKAGDFLILDAGARLRQLPRRHLDDVSRLRARSRRARRSSTRRRSRCAPSARRNYRPGVTFEAGRREGRRDSSRRRDSNEFAAATSGASSDSAATTTRSAWPLTT